MPTDSPTALAGNADFLVIRAWPHSLSAADLRLPVENISVSTESSSDDRDRFPQADLPAVISHKPVPSNFRLGDHPTITLHVRMVQEQGPSIARPVRAPKDVATRVAKKRLPLDLQ